MRYYAGLDISWHIATSMESKLSHYRLSDNYLRFYLKYIEPNHNKIMRGDFDDRSISSLPGWNSIMGFQFENLVINNRRYLLEGLNLSGSDVITSNPYFQQQTSRSQKCQIDYMIQTKFNNLFVCEIKFSKNEIGPSIMDEMRNKIAKLKLPKGFSCWPVLVHVNGVHEKVEDSGYFTKIIDFGELLQQD